MINNSFNRFCDASFRRRISEVKLPGWSKMPRLKMRCAGMYTRFGNNFSIYPCDQSLIKGLLKLSILVAVETEYSVMLIMCVD